jgi:hypothetical protein
VEEWDTFIHRHCIPEFQESREGDCVMIHGHFVQIPEIAPGEVGVPEGWLAERDKRREERALADALRAFVLCLRADHALGAWMRQPPQARGLREGLVQAWDDCAHRYGSILSNMRDELIKEHAQELKLTAATFPLESAARFCPGRKALFTE